MTAKCAMPMAAASLLGVPLGELQDVRLPALCEQFAHLTPLCEALEAGCVRMAWVSYCAKCAWSPRMKSHIPMGTWRLGAQVPELRAGGCRLLQFSRLSQTCRSTLAPIVQPRTAHMLFIQAEPQRFDQMEPGTRCQKPTVRQLPYYAGPFRMKHDDVETGLHVLILITNMPPVQVGLVQKWQIMYVFTR